MDHTTQHSVTITRRSMLRLIGGAALATASVAALGASQASAGRTWCKRDPVVKIDGKVADIFLSSYTELDRTTTGPAEIVVSIPRGSTGELLAADRGFGGYGYEVTFLVDETLKKSSISTQVQVKAFVPSADGSLPLKVDFAPRSSDLRAASAQGLVNKYWVTLRTR
jgi:hypothetical protein